MAIIIRELGVLRAIVAHWDSLDAIGPEESAEPLKNRMDELIEQARLQVEREDAQHLMTPEMKALEPIANMYRYGCDATELACERGVNLDKTILTSGDFERAYNLMPDAWKRDHAEQY